jgi:hypothetical protein
MFDPGILALMTSLRRTVGWRGLLPGLCLALTMTARHAPGLVAAAPLPQDAREVAPQAPAQILKVTPGQAQRGSEVTLEIEGRNFARGVYVSFSHPAVRVLATTRVSDERLETRVEIGPTTPAGTLRLYVSNAAGPVAESQLTIVGGAEPPAALGPASGAAAAVKTSFVPAKISTESAPVEAAAEGAAGKAGGPEVTAVEPPRAAPGSEVALKITGENFAQGATVAFSNPGIRVLETKVASAKEITVNMKVAEDAPTGSTGLFVVNPDDSETEFPFEVAKEVSQAGGDQSAPAASQPAADNALSFEVLNLGEGIDIFHNVNKPKGTLSVTGGKVKYEEAGEEVFSAALGDIQEVAMNVLLGVSTGTFHLTLKSGKTFNFVPASLRPAETTSIVEALRKALK